MFIHPPTSHEFASHPHPLSHSPPTTPNLLPLPFSNGYPTSSATAGQIPLPIPHLPPQPSSLRNTHHQHHHLDRPKSAAAYYRDSTNDTTNTTAPNTASSGAITPSPRGYRSRTRDGRGAGGGGVTPSKSASLALHRHQRSASRPTELSAYVTDFSGGGGGGANGDGDDGDGDYIDGDDMPPIQQRAFKRSKSATPMTEREILNAAHHANSNGGGAGGGRSGTGLYAPSPDLLIAPSSSPIPPAGEDIKRPPRMHHAHNASPSPSPVRKGGGGGMTIDPTTGEQRRPHHRRRKTEELLPHETWLCPYTNESTGLGCGKMYRTSSSRSISKHVSLCKHRPIDTPSTAHLPPGQTNGMLLLGADGRQRAGGGGLSSMLKVGVNGLIGGVGKLKQKKRRKSSELAPHERWNCPYGCGQFFRSTSTKSIHRHKVGCERRGDYNTNTMSDITMQDTIAEESTRRKSQLAKEFAKVEKMRKKQQQVKAANDQAASKNNNKTNNVNNHTSQQQQNPADETMHEITSSDAEPNSASPRRRGTNASKLVAWSEESDAAEEEGESEEEDDEEGEEESDESEESDDDSSSVGDDNITPLPRTSSRVKAAAQANASATSAAAAAAAATATASSSVSGSSPSSPLEYPTLAEQQQRRRSFSDLFVDANVGGEETMLGTVGGVDSVGGLIGSIGGLGGLGGMGIGIQGMQTPRFESLVAENDLNQMIGLNNTNGTHSHSITHSHSGSREGSAGGGMIGDVIGQHHHHHHQSHSQHHSQRNSNDFSMEHQSSSFPFPSPSNLYQQQQQLQQHHQSPQQHYQPPQQLQHPLKQEHPQSIIPTSGEQFQMQQQQQQNQHNIQQNHNHHQRIHSHHSIPAYDPVKIEPNSLVNNSNVNNEVTSRGPSAMPMNFDLIPNQNQNQPLQSNPSLGGEMSQLPLEVPEGADTTALLRLLLQRQQQENQLLLQQSQFLHAQQQALQQQQQQLGQQQQQSHSHFNNLTSPESSRPELERPSSSQSMRELSQDMSNMSWHQHGSSHQHQQHGMHQQQQQQHNPHQPLQTQPQQQQQPSSNSPHLLPYLPSLTPQQLALTPTLNQLNAIPPLPSSANGLSTSSVSSHPPSNQISPLLTSTTPTSRPVSLLPKKTMKSRRVGVQLPLNERWTCPLGCGKFYKKSSSNSIKRHALECLTQYHANKVGNGNNAAPIITSHELLQVISNGVDRSLMKRGSTASATAAATAAAVAAIESSTVGLSNPGSRKLSLASSSSVSSSSGSPNHVPIQSTQQQPQQQQYQPQQYQPQQQQQHMQSQNMNQMQQQLQQHSHHQQHQQQPQYDQMVNMNNLNMNMNHQQHHHNNNNHMNNMHNNMNNMNTNNNGFSQQLPPQPQNHYQQQQHDLQQQQQQQHNSHQYHQPLSSPVSNLHHSHPQPQHHGFDPNYSMILQHTYDETDPTTTDAGLQAEEDDDDEGGQEEDGLPVDQDLAMMLEQSAAGYGMR